MSSGIDDVLSVIKKHKWILGMGNVYLNKWEKFVHKYACKLNEIPIKKETGYTPHDFSFHCKDIYYIIENVLLGNVTITEEESFVLAVAVLLHDISMTLPRFERGLHSQQSVTYIEKEISEGEELWNAVDVQTLKAIKQVIRAHSDIKEYGKDEKERITAYTLRETEIYIGGEGGRLHVRWLAGVLRLADELDITVRRKGVADQRYKELDDNDVDESYSKQCWEQLNYFEDVRLNKATIQILLYQDYLKVNLTDDKPNILKNIKKIKQKITQQVFETNQYAFDEDEEYANKIKIRSVRIIDNGVGLSEEELGEDLGRESTYALHAVEGDSEIEDEGIDLGHQYVTEIDNVKGKILANRMLVEENSDIEKSKEEIGRSAFHLGKETCQKITEFVYSENLIDYGHYRLNRRFCAEKWIDVRAVLSDIRMSQMIDEKICEDLRAFLNRNSIDKGDVLLVGISMNGNILASRIAFGMGMSFTYIVPQRLGILGSDMEKETIIDKKKVVLFTGSISSYDTITRVIYEYFRESDILRVYTVFLRKIRIEYSLPEFMEDMKKKINSKIIYLNDDFPCEILGREECVHRKYGTCIAKNEKAYAEMFEWPLAVKVKQDGLERIFVNNIIGCSSGCKYCYLRTIGIKQRQPYYAKEAIAEFERLHDVSVKKSIVSFGCYSECMIDDNLDEMKTLITYFAEQGYFMQISTKRKLNHTWLEQIEKVLIKPQQLNIYTSLPTLSQANIWEPQADCVEDRMHNFTYQSADSKIKMYMYIKPYIENVTLSDIEQYVYIQKEYDIETIVGRSFTFDETEGECIRVGIDKMYEKDSLQMENFVKRLSESGKVYYHSTEPIRERMQKDGKFE